MKNTKKTGSDGIQANVVLVHTSKDTITRALSEPEITALGDKTFLAGKLISPDSGHFDNGKRVLLNLQYVVSITEFDSASAFMSTRKESNLKLLNPKK
jgi:hypothetical protein